MGALILIRIGTCFVPADSHKIEFFNEACLRTGGAGYLVEVCAILWTDAVALSLSGLEGIQHS